MLSGGRCYAAEDTREFPVYDMPDLDLLELPWHIANSIGEVQGEPRALLLEWRRIRKEGGVQFQRIFAPAIDENDLVRESLKPEDISVTIIDLDLKPSNVFILVKFYFVRAQS